MTFIKEYSGVVALVILAILALTGMFFPKSTDTFGSTACSGITCLSGGLRLVSDAGGAFESDVAATFAALVTMTGDLTVNGGSVNVTTTNSATSTIAVGCIQMTATSTATPYKIVLGASQLATTTFGAGTGSFALIAVPGTCPNL